MRLKENAVEVFVEPKRKMFVLDTNVLLTDPEALFKFGEHSITLPITVIEELDGKKGESGDLGFNAREVSRTLDRLTEFGDPDKGVSLGAEKGWLYIEARDTEFHYKVLKDHPDNYILGTAQDLATTDPNTEVVLVTKDVNLRLKARSVGLKAEDYLHLKQDTSGIGDIGEMNIATDDAYKRLSQGQRITPSDIYNLQGDLGLNTCFVAISPDGRSSVLARVQPQGIAMISTKMRPCGIKPRNAEQRFLIDVLVDSDIDLVICNGVAGTGKTLLSVACGIESIEHLGKQHSVMITKAIMPVGKDIGYLKGDKEEKIAEWLAPFYDNLEFIEQLKGKDFMNRMDREDKIEVDALTYIRGRSLMNRFVIVDEVQNLKPIEVKTIITRIANGSKLVLLGDLQQIDNPYLDARDNGLAYAMSRMCGLPNVAVLNLVKSERGRLASQAIERL